MDTAMTIVGCVVLAGTMLVFTVALILIAAVIDWKGLLK